MRTKHQPFLEWTKREVTIFCLRNGYGEPKFCGKTKTMYVKKSIYNWGNRILIELGLRINYKTVLQ